MDRAWMIITVAGLFEIVWAICMHMSEGFTRWDYTLATAVFLCISVYLLSRALELGVPVGTGYAVWTGIGAVGTLVVSVVLGIDVIVWMQVAFVMLVILGVVGLQASEGGHPEEDDGE